jgi:NAD(P)H-flavin reductase
MLPERFRVLEALQETADTWTLTLEAMDRDTALAFTPGQFTMLYSFGSGEVPISISGDPSAPERLVHTVRAVGSATEAICRARAGDVLGVRGPFGSHWPLEAALGDDDVVVIAGGLGLAPLRPVIYELLTKRDRVSRAIVLYGGRQPDQLLFGGELPRWRNGGLDVEVTVDIATGDWRGKVGVVPTLIGKATFDPAATVAFICGPEVMMRFSAQALLESGVSPDRIHVSMERNMKCAVGHCGHCQLGPEFVCRDGPVFSYARIEKAFSVREM